MNVGDSTRAGLTAALEAWAGDPILAATLADSARAYLVLDGAATAILHASAAAGPFRDAVSDEAGTLNPALAGQIRAVGGTARPRLVRLRLDPRRIAPPTACLIAGGTIDGAPALLLIAVGPLPAFRPRPVPPATTDRPDDHVMPAAPVAAAAPIALDPGDAVVPMAGDRFVWRSDAADRLATISGASFGPLAPRLVGHSWADLAGAGRLRDADAFLAAVGSRRTFRALPAVLDAGPIGALALDLSGACLGRSGDTFSGLGGYGVVRAVIAPSAALEPPTDAAQAGPDPVVPVPDPQLPDTVSPPDAEAGGPGSEGADRTLPDIRKAAWPPATITAARFGSPWAGDPFARDPWSGARGPAPVPDIDAAPAPIAVLPDPEPAPVEQSPPSESPVAVQEGADAALSVTEHAAFREIARALGARYAGDDEIRDPADAADARGASGAVMPFPTLRAVEPETPVQPDGVAPPLDDLPLSMLIHRGDAVLAANRRLLDLTGYADLASLQAAGLHRLFPGLAPADRAAGAGASAGPRIVETAQGGSRPVAIERGPTTWRGEPATCMILRVVDEADPARERAAERLAQSFRDGHAADARATLDALDDGVVTLDPASRIVAMNRAAAGLFGCDPREVVGTGFDTLFEAAQRDAVRAGIAGLGTETRIAAAGGRPLTLRVSGRDGARVALLRPAPDDAARARPDFDRAAFLDRLDREIRTPVEGIVGLADGILAEPHGPVDERYRTTLRAIRAAGDHVRGLVSDLIDIATIESGGLALSVRPLPLNELVSGCVELLQPEAARGRIVLRTSFSPDLAPLEADEPSLRQAALTVIGEAIRATAAGGQVIVSTTPGERGGIALKVRGTGPGARSAEPEDGHDPRSGSESHVGGLGLPLTKALVEANQGSLRISTRGNDGTLVEILLPGTEFRTG
ncbi:PAS domain-containing protein [Methylobacterium sp. WL30]|nr:MULTISPECIES: PAS domain-containing sensor histidine kinase [unclassified Methylobacterium]TXN49602.1 PAS domain-containing protein [Methylobacterium sp. WL119]TXN67166.1 PAS domain-containing protein [Methylobacterium sp. WL30]